MNDTPKSDLPEPLKPDEDDDEPIIDLVDEIVDPYPQGDLSELRSKLLDLESEMEELDEDSPDLPDLANLGNLEFDEENELALDGSPPETASTADGAPPSEDDLHWLFEQKEEVSSPATDKGPDSPDSDVAEILDFEDEFLDAEDNLEDLPDSKAADFRAELDAGEDTDMLEIIEIEDEEVDNEIIWFDDSAEVAPPSEIEVETGRTDEVPAAEKDAEFLSETSAADLFDAHLESGMPSPEDEAGVSGLADELVSAAAAGLAGPREAAESPMIEPSTPVSEKMPPAHPIGLSPEAIEAAVERIVARKFGGTMESIILQAIEKAVSKEIERLKHLLLEDDPANRT
jgi:hypothetical protein